MLRMRAWTGTVTLASLCAVTCAAYAIEAPTGPVKPSMGPVTVHDMSLEMAKAAADATIAECRSKGFRTAVSVVDRAGNVIVSMRDELATPQMAEMSRRKAYTARMFRVTTADWAKRTREDPVTAP